MRQYLDIYPSECPSLLSFRRCSYLKSSTRKGKMIKKIKEVDPLAKTKPKGFTFNA